MIVRTLIVCLLVASPGAIGQTPPPADPPAPKPAPAPDPLPGLDELLGLTGEKPARPRDAADPAAAELERKLSLQEAAEQFKQAVELMHEAAGRIGDARDTGLQTQRMQESIIRKLDMLIKAAEQQAQQSSSSSSSSSSQQDQDPRNQPSQPQPADGDQQRQGDNRTEQMPPGLVEGPLNPELAARGALWGSLPARVREALLQGTQDTYSSLYQRLTESYFRKLAEEPR